LSERFGFDGDNTLYGQSICSDEINNEAGDLASNMVQQWGEVYPLGGIGGAPYAGKQGFNEFASHVPEDGNLLLLFGPHIAISEGGELGKYLRDGQAKLSGACGAVLAAYSTCRDGTIVDYDPDDMQQSWLRSKVSANLDRIKRAEFPIHKLIEVAYEAVQEMVMDIVRLPEGKGKLAIIGGIQINMPAPYIDHYQPLFFQVLSHDADPVDLLDDAFIYHHDNPARYQVLDFPERRFNNVFQWLRFSPPPESPMYKTLHKAFPGALPDIAVVRRTAKVLEGLGLKEENTIYGQSICPDELNNEVGSLGNLMRDQWGPIFPLGGIGGAPFVGKTGFTAFSHHVPDDGNVIVLFGPHIAISDLGELGKFHRIGQAEVSMACGALLSAFEAVRDGNVGEFDSSDMQCCWLKEKVAEQFDRIAGADDQLAELLHAAYGFIHDKIHRIVNNEFGTTGKLVLIGGIQVNLPEPYLDHFQPLEFQVTSLCAPTTDLMPTFDRMYDINSPDAHVPAKVESGEDAADLNSRNWVAAEVHEAGFATRESIEDLRKDLWDSQAETTKRLESVLAGMEASSRVGVCNASSLPVFCACAATAAATALLVSKAVCK
jgi:hypothetical protein